MKDRINDAICATKAAAEEGIVISGGVVLLYASRVIKDLKGTNMDQNTGIKIVAEALKITCITICKNAGLPGDLIVHQLLEQNNTKLWIDTQTGQKCYLFD